jgi:hypothetical protein
MAKAVISHDKDLPEIPDRQAHLPPTSYLRKREGAENEFEIVGECRPSKLLLVTPGGGGCRNNPRRGSGRGRRVTPAAASRNPPRICPRNLTARATLSSPGRFTLLGASHVQGRLRKILTRFSGIAGINLSVRV